MPDIVHSTAVRWAAEPADRQAALAGFDRAAATWQPLEITVRGAAAVSKSPNAFLVGPNAGRRCLGPREASPRRLDQMRCCGGGALLPRQIYCRAKAADATAPA